MIVATYIHCYTRLLIERPTVYLLNCPCSCQSIENQQTHADSCAKEKDIVSTKHRSHTHCTSSLYQAMLLNPITGGLSGVR